METAVTVLGATALTCGSGLVAFRWWLSSRPKPVEESKLTSRLEALEQRMARSELGRLR